MSNLHPRRAEDRDAPDAAAVPNAMKHNAEKLTERTALDHIKKYPGSSNASLARVLGFSVGGVEKLLRRLRATGHIRQRGKGRARLFLFPVEHLTSGGVSKAGDSLPRGEDRPSLPIARREMATGDYIAERLVYAENCLEAGAFGHACNHLEKARKRLQEDADIPTDEKVRFLAELKVQANRYFAFGVGAKMAAPLPAAQQRELALTLCRATPEMLAAFRERVEAGALLGNREVIALINEGEAQTSLKRSEQQPEGHT
jgi:hypothetical protein